MGVSTQTVRAKIVTPKTVQVFNVTGAAIAGDEFSQVLPDGTKKLLIRSRDKAELKFNYTSIDASSEWITLKPYAVYSVEGVELNGHTLYMQGSVTNQTVEIEVWV